MADVGTVVITEESFGLIKKVKFVWTSDAAGNANKTTTKTYDGQLVRAVTVPAAAGSAPTDDYDVQVLDDDGYDAAAGALANRDTANTEQVITGMTFVAHSHLRLNVSAAGNAKGGTVILYLRT